MTIKETSTISDEEAPVGEKEIEIPSAEKWKDVDDLKKDPSIVTIPTVTDDNMEEVEFPIQFYCPLSKKVMIDPVVHPDGVSAVDMYGRLGLFYWLWFVFSSTRCLFRIPMKGKPS